MDALSEEQRAALAGVQVGDLLFVQKVPRPSAYNNDNDDESEVDSDEDDDDDDDGHGDSHEEGEGDAANGESAEQDGSQDDGEAGDKDVTADARDSDRESDSEEEEEGSAEDSDETEATDIPMPPRMYVVSAAIHDFSGKLLDLKVCLLTFSSTLGSDELHTYQIYRNHCSHNHPSTSELHGASCDVAGAITEILKDDAFQVSLKPNGDVVKFADQGPFYANGVGRCITGCRNGYLSSHEMLANMIKDYDPPTLSFTGQDLSKIMPPVCPVCFGIGVLKEQQTLQGAYLLAIPPDMGEIVSFIGSLDSRRRQLGYHFRQFDEREWGMHFDDMMSEDEEDEEEDDGRWEDWNEAMDPNNVIQTRPASDETIASLLRETAKQAHLPEDARCKICQDDVQDDQIIIELPCGHKDHHEDCIVQWLKYNTTCPTCRGVVPAVEIASSKDTNEGVDGADAIMSDV